MAGHLLGLGTALLLTLTGCGSTDPVSPAEPRTAHEDPDPLVLYPAGNGGDGALLRGTLQLVDHCLYVEADGGVRWLIALPSPGATWDPTHQAIRVAGNKIRIGELADFGGGESTAAPESITWVRPPAGCSTAAIWFVTTLVGPRGGA